MSQHSWFEGRSAILATMHRKEQAIAPLLEAHLGVTVEVPANFNTDRFGTFTREIKRPDTQLATARLKAKTVLRETGATLAIASEGSFFPHPYLPLVAYNRELVLLLDSTDDLEVVGYAVSTETNHSGRVVKSLEETLEFAEKAGFPEHGLVVMTDKNSTAQGDIRKGITTLEALSAAVEEAIAGSADGTAYVETDMRAMYNPTRLQVIAQATQDLIEKLNQFCPQCSCPGFDVVERKPGLPCLNCRRPTLLTLAHIYGCQRCDAREEILYPDDLEFADPGRCDYCNP